MAAVYAVLVVGAALALVFGVVWLRWWVRDRRRRRNRLVEVECWHDELDRQERRLRMRVTP